jgi:small neutral amino acid transporter SnatA (MarC family)
VLENDIIADRHEDSAKRISAGAVLAIVAAIFIAALLLLRYSKKFRKIIGRKRRRKSRA